MLCLPPVSYTHLDVYKRQEETLRIAQEGRERRAAAEKELAVMETELKDRLTSLAARKSREEIAAASGTETRQSAPGQGGTGSGV